LLAADFISVFICLEIMMVASSIIIFIGGQKSSLSSAKQYFITHLTSSSMIMMGILHIISKSGNIELQNAAELIYDPSYSPAIIIIMLTGMLINIAAFPFTGWMVNYYQKASPSGFIYLISFTTKLSVVLLVKVFAGLDALKYIAALFIFYSAAKIIFEDNLQSLLCYLSVMAIGLMLMGISNGSPEAVSAVICYLFIHIIYKSLLSICIATIIDQTGHTECTDITRIKSKLINIGFIVAIALMINFPGTSSLHIKSIISHLFTGTVFYFIIVIITFSAILALPWQQYYEQQHSKNIKLNIYTKISLVILTAIAVLAAIFGANLLALNQKTNLNSFSLFSFESLKQLLIIFAALITALKLKRKRFKTNPINLSEWLGNKFFYYYSRWDEKTGAAMQPSESWSINSLERQAKSKLSIMHNQQTAIFIVFIIFIIMFCSFILKF
jgi:multicomponent Na+:H+ antiporter subunit D